ncbi:hypothetical protein LZ31DRAFT_539577 [Colletotrichum somersetense]|nr:hypothetical protein LZ31DRAFT_539577 [Colletotrichum somersetense]
MEPIGQYTFGDFQSLSNEMLWEEQPEQEQDQQQFFSEDMYAQFLEQQWLQEQLQEQQPLPDDEYDDDDLSSQYTTHPEEQLPEQEQLTQQEQQFLPNDLSWDVLRNGLAEQQGLQEFFPNPLADLSAEELAAMSIPRGLEQELPQEQPQQQPGLPQFPTPSPEMGMNDDFYKSLPRPLSASASIPPYPSLSIPLPSPPSSTPATIDPRLLEMVAPVADHPPHGVGEYAQGSKDDGDVQMEDIPLAPQNSSPRRPSVERTMDQALAPNTNGNRVAKRTRAVKANSCDACRRSKVKCVTAEGAQGCNACLKKGHKCHVSGVDGRTHKTNRDRLDKTSSSVNEYLRDAFLLCSEIADQEKEKRSMANELLQNMVDFKQVRSCISVVNKRPQKMFPFNSGPFRPPMLEDQTKLAVVRNYRGPQLKLAAQHQGKIIAALLAMIAFGSDKEVWIASSHVAKVMKDNTRLDSDCITLSIREHCLIPDNHLVYEIMRQGINKCFDPAR